MILNRLIGRRRRANTLKRPAPRRRLSLEFLEPKAMVAGDIFSMGAASMFGVDSLLGANAPLIEQLSDSAVQVDIHLKITDTNGIAITQIEAGQDFILQVWVQDVRADAAQYGVFAAYTNVTFDSSLVTPSAGTSINHGTAYTNSVSGDTLTAGKISEAGGFQAGSGPLGAAEHMLFSQQFHVDAAASGNVSFNTSAATVLPQHDTLTFNPPTTVPTAEIGFGAASLSIIAQPTLTSSSVQQAEGTGAVSTMTFTVNLTGTTVTTPVTVDYSTADGTAHAGSDYLAKTGTLTFAVGETSKTFDVTVLGDSTFESDEQFSVNFTNAAGALAPATVTGTITNDDLLPAISVNDISASEDNAGVSAASFVISLSNPSDQPVSVDYTFAPGTAAAGSDYQATNGTVTFAAGETSKQIDIGILGDTVFEANETFTITLQNQQGGTLAKSTGTATITNDDTAPTLAINSPAAITEPTGDTSTLQFTVTLTGASEESTTVQWNTVDGTAIAGQDYQAASGQLTFLPGETTKTVSVTILDDSLSEATEAFSVQLSSPTNATVPAAGATGAGTILDDNDPLPTVSITGPVTIQEGNSGNTVVTYNVQLSGPSGQPVTVEYETADGTGVAGTDYEHVAGTLTFAAGVSTLPITVNVLGNTIDQDNRVFKVNLSNPHLTTVDVGQVETTIEDDDAPPVITVSDVSVLEGDSGTKTLTFTVNLSNASEKTITVDYATADGTATAGADYVAKSGTLTFAPLSTSQTVSVVINGDSDVENNETLALNLSNAVNATPTSLTATGTIQDDDGFVVTIGDAQVTETGSGNTTMTFTATLGRPASAPLTFDWATAAGTAAAGADYQTANGTATFAAGATTTTFTVNVIGDTLDEDDETFAVNLTNPSYGTLAAAQATGMILDNDAAPTVSVTGGSVAEGNSGTKTLDFTVTLDNPSGKTVTVDFATANGTATAGSDYVSKTGTVTFAPGEISKTVSIVVNGDTDVETDETLTVNLSNASNATLGTAQATGTILDDDNFVLTVGNTSVTEGNTGTTQLTFTLTLSKPAVGALTVSYLTSPGSVNPAEAGKDFTLGSGTATIADGATSTTVTVTVAGDSIDENDETIALFLTNPSYGTVQGSPATGTIIDDDAPPTLSIANASAAEGDATGNPLSFVVTLSQASGKSVTVNYATAGGTATEGTDYTATSGTLTFAPGETSKTITVNSIGDTTTEDDEAFTVNLSGVTNATIPGSQSATGSILNDETPSISIANASLVEGSSGSATQMTFTVTLSKPTTNTVTVQIDTADGTATAGEDYQNTSGPLTFAPGETSKQFTINIGGDTLFETDETFLIKLSSATNATIATPQATGTILNDDTAPRIFVTAPSPVIEGDSGVQTMTIQVFLLDQSGLPVTVNYSTADVSATAGQDYQAASGSITFAPGETLKTITVNIIGDGVVEPTETFSINMTATNATFFGTTGATTSIVGTITDDDAPSSISGSIFRDTNNDGVMNNGEALLAIPVQLVLNKLDAAGNVISSTSFTATDGHYSFKNLSKGTYTVTETTPAGYTDGIDTPGAGVSKTGINDQFTFTVVTSQDLVGNNFAERGLAAQAITKGMFLGSRT